MNKTYTTTSGDRWDMIAFRELGSEAHTGKLIEANRQYRDYFIFPAGIVLIIPQIDTAEEVSAQLPPWKRGNA